MEPYLAALDTAGALFDTPASQWVPSDEASTTDPATLVGARVGAWRLEQLLGIGGMGSVYRAVREDGGFAQAAAVKMLRPDVLPGLGPERLRRERQLLARLSHRNIATILDGGVTDTGQPWFALELIDGEPITAWCRRHALSPPERLALFRQVCGAVESAHGQLVVHRDIKPGNILVTADGTVKLLDFGIAKLLEPEPMADGELTIEGASPATPTYASPEQLDGAAISTASDTYSLGVVLHELLTGTVPFRAGPDLASHRRAVAERAPPPPATLLTPEHARTCGLSSARMQRWLRGDIATVLAAALHKDPARRYASAGALAADLGAVIEGRPISARRDSAGYRLRRLVGRNRIATAVIVVLVIGVIGAAAIAIDRARRAGIALEAADLEAARSARVTTFLSEVLAAPDPWTGDRDVSVRELLDQASARTATDFGDDPAVEARVRLALGRSYRGLGQMDAARRELARAHQLVTAPDDPVRAVIARNFAELLAETGELEEARRWYDTAAAISARAGDSLGIATVSADLAWLFGRMGVVDSGRHHGELAVDVRRRLGAPSLDLANALNNLAVVELEAGRPEAARALLDEAILLLRQAGRTGEPPLSAALSVLAGLHSDLGKHALAEPLYRESLELRRRIFGAGHPDEVGVMINLAVNALALDSAARALAITDSIAARVSPGGLSEAHPLMAAARTARGRALTALGRHREAVTVLRQALADRRVALPEGHPALAFTLGALAEALHGTGDAAEARRVAAEAHAILLAAFGPDHPRTREAATRLQSR